MAFASCPDCGFKYRLGDELSGKHIRCPNCRAAIRVFDKLPDSQTECLSSNVAESDPAELFIGRMIERRGPVSVTQLELLARWNLIDIDSPLSNESGIRRSTVREYLDWGGWPTPQNRAIPAKKSAARPAPLPEVPTPPERVSRPPLGTGMSLEPAAEPEETAESGSVDFLGCNMLPDEFRSLIDRAVQMERTARTVRTVSPGTAAHVPGYVPTAGARLVRRRHFSQALSGLALVSVISAIVFSVCCSAVMGMFPRL